MCRNTLTSRTKRRDRRGSITVLSAFVIVIFLAMLMFAIDLGYMHVVRTQAQCAADSAALAAAWEMAGDDRIRGQFESLKKDAQQVAKKYAGYHRVADHDSALLLSQDIEIGQLDNLSSKSSAMSFDKPADFNAVKVTVRATSDHGRASGFFFAKFFGHDEFDMAATATAAFGNGVIGFRTSKKHPRTSLLPFTFNMADWDSLVATDESGGPVVRDEWAYDPSDGSVSKGSDGIPEIAMYPIRNGAGNWGTIDIGNNNNSTKDLERQIRDGVNDADLEKYGGKLQLNPETKSISLNGETGISAGMKDSVEDIIGHPRTIPLYRSAAGTGNTLDYEVVGFVGIRVMDVVLTGGKKEVVIQPAVVCDPTAIIADWGKESDFVIQRVRLVR